MGKACPVFPISTSVGQGCVFAQFLFKIFMDFLLDKVMEQSHCGAPVGKTRDTVLVFTDNALDFAASLEVLVLALKTLHELTRSLGLQVCWQTLEHFILGLYILPPIRL